MNKNRLLGIFFLVLGSHREGYIDSFGRGFNYPLTGRGTLGVITNNLNLGY